MIKEKIEYAVVKFFVWFLGLLPNKTIYKITYFVAMVFFRLEKRRSTLTIKNLTLAFPDKSKEEIYNLAKKSYESLSMTLAEIILMLNDKIDFDSMVNNKDDFLQKLSLYTKNAKNGIIIITAHFSNWELAAQFLPKNGYPMTAIGRRGNNELIENNFTTPFRERYGNKNIYKEQAILNIIQTLKENKIVGLLIDQKAGGKSSIKVKFFGHDADTTNSIAVLKLKYNPLVIPIFMPRTENGKYTPIIIEPIEYIANEESNKAKKVEKMTQEYNDILEEVIKAYPEQWFWMHNRWRLA